MKKETILIISLMLIIPLISAIDISLSKPNYQPQETLQVEITGNFITPLNIENILLYKEDVPRSTPVISDLTKFNNIYYLYMILPNQEGNFSIKIQNTKYIESGIEKTQDIVQDFKIQKTNKSALQINPGFIKAKKDFSIKIKSLFQNQDVSAHLELTGQLQNLSLIEDVEKTISFSVDEIESTKTNLKINDYDVPVFIIKESGEETNILEEQNNSIINNTNNSINNQPKINISNFTKEEIESLSCFNIGEKCKGNEECDAETESSLEGPCCIGSCIEKKKSSSWFFGLLIIIILVVVIGFVYKKAKLRQRLKKHTQILEEKTDKFKERMSGEVSKSLGRS